MSPDIRAALFSVATGYEINCLDAAHPKLVRYGPDISYETVKHLLHTGLVEVSGDGTGFKISPAGLTAFYDRADVSYSEPRNIFSAPSITSRPIDPNHRTLEQIEALLYQ